MHKEIQFYSHYNGEALALLEVTSIRKDKPRASSH